MNQNNIIKTIDYEFPCDFYCGETKIGSFRTLAELKKKDLLMYKELIDYVKYDPAFMPYSFKAYNGGMA